VVQVGVQALRRRGKVMHLRRNHNRSPTTRTRETGGRENAPRGVASLRVKRCGPNLRACVRVRTCCQVSSNQHPPRFPPMQRE
jgi:hypothetical protein